MHILTEKVLIIITISQEYKYYTKDVNIIALQNHVLFLHHIVPVHIERLLVLIYRNHVTATSHKQCMVLQWYRYR